jgi:hypothetical protein
MSADVIALDITSSTEVWWKANRICSRSTAPQRNAGRALRSLGITGDAVVHFRRWGRTCRAVVLWKLWSEDAPACP